MLEEGVGICAGWAQALRVKKVNVLAGNSATCKPGQAFDTLVENLWITGEHFADTGVMVMLEAINPFDAPGVFVSNLRLALDVIEAVDHPNVQFQFDFYHMARTEASLADAIFEAGRHIGHVQFADNPGRHEPGSGKIDFPAAFKALKQAGYTGEITAEYLPQKNIKSNLRWMHEFQKL